MALSEIDRNLLERCLANQPRSWEDFVDRFMGLVMHVINHTAQCRSILLSPGDREDLAGEVMLTIVDNDYAVLRQFRGKSSLATYLTVIARRVVVRKMLENQAPTSLATVAEQSTTDTATDAATDTAASAEERLTNREEVDQLLAQLNGPEANVVRMYHLEGKTYQEISRIAGMPTNSIGPMLSRIRSRLRGQSHV